jgi:hypothetical protein
MTKTSTITPERVAQLLSYDPETGLFTWKPRGVPRFDNRFSGKQAGTLSNSTGYLQITIDHVCLRLNRVAYVLMMGEWPSDRVDHKNLDKTDNRWCNLRASNNSQNMANTGKYCTNTTGYKGVTKKNKGKPYQASITRRGKYYHLGTYDTPEEAHAAYCQAAKDLFGDFARTN